MKIVSATGYTAMANPIKTRSITTPGDEPRAQLIPMLKSIFHVLAIANQMVG